MKKKDKAQFRKLHKIQNNKTKIYIKSKKKKCKRYLNFFCWKTLTPHLGP
jgi:hypothetical protein